MFQEALNLKGRYEVKQVLIIYSLGINYICTNNKRLP